MKLRASSLVLGVFSSALLLSAATGCGDSSDPSVAATSSDQAITDDAVKATLTISPSTVHLKAGGATAKFTIESTGLKNGDTISFNGPPDGIEEDTSVFIEHGKDAVTVWADENTKAFTGSQTFSVTYFSSAKKDNVTLKAKVTIIVD